MYCCNQITLKRGKKKEWSSSFSIQSVFMDKQKKSPLRFPVLEKPRDWPWLMTQKTDTLWVIKFSDCRDISIWGSGRFTGMNCVSQTSTRFCRNQALPLGEGGWKCVHITAIFHYLCNGIKWHHTSIRLFNVWIMDKSDNCRIHTHLVPV